MILRPTPGVDRMSSMFIASRKAPRWKAQSIRNGKGPQNSTQPRLHSDRADDCDQSAADPYYGGNSDLKAVDSAGERIRASPGSFYFAPGHRPIHARQTEGTTIA